MVPLPNNCARSFAFGLLLALQTYIPLRMPSFEPSGITGCWYCSFITVR